MELKPSEEIHNLSLVNVFPQYYTYLLEYIFWFLGGERERPLLRLAELGRLLVELLLALLQKGASNINQALTLNIRREFTELNKASWMNQCVIFILHAKRKYISKIGASGAEQMYRLSYIATVATMSIA